MQKLVLYWGCRHQAGHYLHTPTGKVRDHREADALRVPCDTDLDGSPIFLPFPERTGEGALTYLPANDRTVLAWWGSPFDRRGAVNSAIITEDNCTADEVWGRFIEAFPDLATKVERPSVKPLSANAA